MGPRKRQPCAHLLVALYRKQRPPHLEHCWVSAPYASSDWTYPGTKSSNTLYHRIRHTHRISASVYRLWTGIPDSVGDRLSSQFDLHPSSTSSSGQCFGISHRTLLVFTGASFEQSIAPLLIVLRVAQGRSLSKETLEGTMRETETAGPIQFRTTKATQASSATAFQFSTHQGSFVADGKEKETSGSAIFQSKEAVNHEELLEMSDLTR